MRKVVFVVAIIAAVLVAGCSSMETTYNAMTFQEAEQPGGTNGQRFLVYPLGEVGFFGGEHLPPLLRNYNDSEFQKRVKECTPSLSPEQSKLRATSLPSIISSAGQTLYEEVFNEIEAKAKRLAKRSVHESRVVITWAPETASGKWRSMRCLLIARLTDTDGDKQEDKIGMLAIVSREGMGPSSSMLQPVYFRLNNSVAITGSNKHPKLKIGMAFTVNAVLKITDKNETTDKLVDVASTALASDIPAVLGKKTPICESKDEAPPPAHTCSFSSDLFLDPPPEAGAIQLAVAVREAGAAARIVNGNGESAKALKSLTKPVFDAFLKQLVNAAKGNGG